VPCAAGTVVLFSANLLHSALPNRSARSRYGLFWHYLPRDFQPDNFRSGAYADRHEL
jgi:ectoine hydroxylase-related dioxygenase (phytanoyl-CoA dioxygenase family)